MRPLGGGGAAPLHQSPDAPPGVAGVGGPCNPGEPRREPTWGRRRLWALSRRLCDVGHPVCPPTVGRWVDDQGDALPGHAQPAAARAAPVARHAQLAPITAPRQAFPEVRRPRLSVETTQMGLLGNCKNAGQAWRQASRDGEPA